MSQLIWPGLVCLLLGGADPEKQPSEKLLREIRAIGAEFKARESKFWKELREFKEGTPENDRRRDEQKKYHDATAERLTKIITTNPDEPAVFEAVLLLADALGYGSVLKAEVIEAVQKHHKLHPKMGEFCFAYRCYPPAWAETLLKETAKRHPAAAVRGAALYSLGFDPLWRIRCAQSYPEAKQFTAEEQKQLLGTAKTVFTEIAEKYPTEKLPDGRTLGTVAKAELDRIKNIAGAILSVGKPAPEIVGKDLDDKDMKLSDFRGKVVVLDFWGDW